MGTLKGFLVGVVATLTIVSSAAYIYSRGKNYDAHGLSREQAALVEKWGQEDVDRREIAMELRNLDSVIELIKDGQNEMGKGNLQSALEDLDDAAKAFGKIKRILDRDDCKEVKENLNKARVELAGKIKPEEPKPELARILKKKK